MHSPGGLKSTLRFIEIIAMWNRPPPPGFQGLRDDLPLTQYQLHLPHWRQAGATYFVTFRLHDSLPQSKLRELREFKAEWERRNPPSVPTSAQQDLAREVMRRVEAWLDQGMGSCILRRRAVSALIEEALKAGDGSKHELGCYVVMPNHVHAIVRPIELAERALEAILQAWKGGSARAINELMKRSGTLWQRESFDRIIRDEEHLHRVIQYIGRNSKQAKLPADAVRLWIRSDWAECGWDFEP